MIKCKEAAHLFSESLIRPLPLRRRIALRVHLLLCKLCRRNVRQIRAIEQIVREYSRGLEEGAGAPGPGLTEEGRERLKAALRHAH